VAVTGPTGEPEETTGSPSPLPRRGSPGAHARSVDHNVLTLEDHVALYRTMTDDSPIGLKPLSSERHTASFDPLNSPLPDGPGPSFAH
jgi:hypothetical protein